MATTPTTPDPDPTAVREPAPAPGEYSHQAILRIISGLMLAMFLGALDQTIVSTSIRTIADDLHGLSAQAWVTTAYLITSTITTPIYGKLGDLWGRKKLFMFAITVFIIGSALCSLSTSMYELAAFRAFQGLGAGGLFTLVLAIIGDIVSPRERAKYTGYFMATFGSSSVLGPVIGGLLAGTDTILGVTGWRWVFLVNVPIGIVALVVVFRTLHVHHVKRSSAIDWMGAVALCICLVPLLVVLEQGREWGWSSGRSVGCFVIAAVGLALFVAAEAKMRDAALIPLRLFTIRPAVVTIIASVIVGMGMFGGMMLLPLYMQIVHGATPTESGFLMLPMVAGLMAASITSGRIISKTGRTRAFPIAGSGLMALGMFALTTISADTHLWTVAIMMLVVGYGVGNCMQPLMLTMQSSVPPTAIGMATSSATFFRQIGGTIGVAIFLSMLFGSVGANIQSAFADARPQIAALAKDPSFQPSSIDREVLAGDNTVFAHVQNDSSIIERMNPVLAHPFKAGFADSIASVFWVSGGLGVLAFLVLLTMPEVELRQQSASAAVAAAEAREDAADG
ncbi:DHA2 family efflux MFS transporter permease subunit [Nocardioides sp. CER19]|uniref:MDR family MFS transporter n=1 Tax=Nocardioides sp. CER19 TaxID=3038538 RepID=UPI00244727ED|nr:DHA2 family efflux MFS transporter permease subunit [Nocardioides sp. CER19]MDH2414057.1 DHA2 family efflux MFS transporter permease subunit [Nocardioides sp. CER19]